VHARSESFRRRGLLTVAVGVAIAIAVTITDGVTGRHRNLAEGGTARANDPPTVRAAYTNANASSIAVAVGVRVTGVTRVAGAGSELARKDFSPHAG
jgi:hypothetical protein